MAIALNDLKIFQAQDNSDNDSGGGSRTSVEVVDGNVNNLFPDISRVDTVSGDVALRKIFPTVFTANRDIYFGAHAMIRKMPTDPKVSALLFNSDDPFDKRLAAQNKIESYVVASYREQFYLFGNHVTGSKAVTFLQTLTATPPTVGEVYLLVDPSGFEQYIRISDMTIQTVTLSWNSGSEIIDYQRRRIISEVEQALEFDFVGSEFDPVGQEVGTTDTFATQIADASKFYSTKPVAVDALVSDTAIKVTSIFESLVPSSKAQTPLVNQDGLTPGSGLKTFTSTPIATIQMNVPGGSWVGKLGNAIIPGSLEVGSSYVDDSLGNITVVGGGPALASIDYSTGQIDNTTGGMTISGPVNFKFKPAAGGNSPLQFTGAILITTSNQGLVFVKNLSPIPSAGQLFIDYRSQGKWYRISGNADGTVGGDPSIGAGVLNDNNDGTGTLSLTLGALPDIDSSLIVSWGSLQRLNNRAVENHPLFLRFSLGHKQIDPTTFSIVAKNQSDVSHTITCDGSGVLSDTGGAITGNLHLSSGEVLISSSVLARFQDPGSLDDVTIAYSHAEPGIGVAGELKVTEVAETPLGDQLPFTLIDRVLNNYTFSLGETVVRESFTMSFEVRYVNDAAYPTIGQSKDVITLESDASGNLRELNRRFDDTTVWGTVSTIGDVTLQLITRNVLGSTIYPDNFTALPRYSTLARFATLVPDVVVTTNYRSNGAASFPLNVSLTDKIENLATYLIKTPGFVAGDVSFTAFDNLTTGIHSFFSEGNLIFQNIDVSGPLQVGTINKSVGLIELQYVHNPSINYLKFKNLTTDELALSDQHSLVFDFRTASTKLVPSSFQLRYATVNGTSHTATTDTNGVITGTDLDSGTSYVDTETGMVHLVFTANAYPASFKYDAVAEVTLPIDPDLLGLNPVRLPPDGRVPVFENGRMVIIFNEVTTAVPGGTPVADQIVTLARNDQSYIEVIDSNGKRLNPTQFVSDSVLGTVTFGNPLVLEDKYAAALVAPYFVVDRVEDMLLATDVQISGDMNLSGALTHAYPKDVSYVASALVWGDTGSRYYNLFAQEIWNSGSPVWSDSLIGDPTTSQYDDINFPIQVDNQSAAPGRWAIIFRSATVVDVAHEVLGIVETSIAITISDVAPLNPATGSPYFIMNRNGFGSGWVANNVVRFNTDSGDNNMWVIRTVQSGALNELTDNVEIEIRGDAN